MSDLINRFIDDGLIQFGRFENDSPVRLHLDMLPSYPDILKEVAVEVTQLMTGSTLERLICTADSIPLGVAVSMETQIPLVYSRGSGQSTVYNLAGAYDVGHPTTLLTNIFWGDHVLEDFIRTGRQVGLDIQTTICIMDMSLKATASPPLSILRLDEIISTLTKERKLPEGQANIVRQWLSVNLHHPDSTVP